MAKKEENGEIMSPAHKEKGMAKSKRHHGGLMSKKGHQPKMNGHHKGAKKY
jgi:hypothetical protein